MGTWAVFVNTDNPITRLSFSQLDAIFGAEHLGGAPGNIRIWGDAGLTGAWHDHQITPYSGLAFEAPAQFVSQTVMGGSVLWNERLRQFGNVEQGKDRSVDAYQEVVDSVAHDASGIGMAGAGYRADHVKFIAIARSPNGPYVDPTPKTVTDRSYPLTRPVRFYINGGPKKKASPVVLAFLRYVLSAEGQALFAQEGDFFPVPPAVAQAETARLR